MENRNNSQHGRRVLQRTQNVYEPSQPQRIDTVVNLWQLPQQQNQENTQPDDEIATQIDEQSSTIISMSGTESEPEFNNTVANLRQFSQQQNQENTQSDDEVETQSNNSSVIASVGNTESDTGLATPEHNIDSLTYSPGNSPSPENSPNTLTESAVKAFNQVTGKRGR